MDIVTERLKLKDIFPKKAKEFAKRYKFKSEDDIQLIRKGLTPADLKVSEEENSIISYITTATVDRDNEIVDPKGAILGDYNKNKVVLWGHDYHSRNLPLGRNQWLKMDDKGIIAKTEYYIKDEFANKVYNYRKDGFPLAESIGFIPLEWDDFENEKDIKANDGAKRKYNKWLLLEYSDVPVPSNPDAVEMAMKKGLVTEEEAKDLIEVEIDEIELSESQEKEQKDVEKIEINQIKDDKKIPESEEKEVIHKPEETEDYIHIPVIDASKFVKDSFRTIDIDKKKGIKAVIGKLKTDPQGSTKVQKFIFDKKPPYNWTMARAQAWIKDHSKEYEDINEKDFILIKFYDDVKVDEIKYEFLELAIKYGDLLAEKKLLEEKLEKEEHETELRDTAIKELEAELKATIEAKTGAVLNKKNKSNLKNAQDLIQEVLDSAETQESEEETKQEYNCECIECSYKMKSDKHCKDIKCPKCGGTMRRAERPGPGQRNVDDVIEIPDKEIVNIELPDKDKKEENSQVMVEIDEKRITDIVNNVFEKHIKADTSISDVKKEITNSIKRAKGKVF